MANEIQKVIINKILIYFLSYAGSAVLVFFYLMSSRHPQSENINAFYSTILPGIIYSFYGQNQMIREPGKAVKLSYQKWPKYDTALYGIKDREGNVKYLLFGSPDGKDNKIDETLVSVVEINIVNNVVYSVWKVRGSQIYTEDKIDAYGKLNASQLQAMGWIPVTGRILMGFDSVRKVSDN